MSKVNLLTYYFSNKASNNRVNNFFILDKNIYPCDYEGTIESINSGEIFLISIFFKYN